MNQILDKPPVLMVESWEGEKWIVTRQEWNPVTERYEAVKEVRP